MTVRSVRYEEFARVVIDAKVRVVETAGSNPKKWISLFKGAGIVTIHKCISIRHALSAQVNQQTTFRRESERALRTRLRIGAATFFSPNSPPPPPTRP
jgi:hypothetical protein